MAKRKTATAGQHKSAVPRLKLKQHKITEPDLQNLRDWSDFFRNLSDRIEVIERNDPRLPDLFWEAQQRFREVYGFEPELYTLVDWPPALNQVAFAVRFNEAPATQEPLFDPLNLYVFCLGNKAYRIVHLEWDGESSIRNHHSTCSLKIYEPDLLEWEFIAKLISDSIREIANLIPPK